MKKMKKYYSERDSIFFRLRSKTKLSKILFADKKKLELLSNGDYYYIFQKKKDDGTSRLIAAPREDLKRVQRRVAELLHRITPPDHLFAPVAGRSYVDNAAHHAGARVIRLLDIKDFFPSCTAQKVVWFFLKRLECSPDVTAILRGLVTRQGSLPQGSPCSPILAYLCYLEMWDEIAALVERAGCRLSVYADDLTISGEQVPEDVIWDVKRTLFRDGHRTKAEKERSRIERPAEITGVVVSENRLLLPNRLHKQLYMVGEELRKARSADHRESLARRLHGRQAQARQIQRRSDELGKGSL